MSGKPLVFLAAEGAFSAIGDFGKPWLGHPEAIMKETSGRGHRKLPGLFLYS